MAIIYVDTFDNVNYPNPNYAAPANTLETALIFYKTNVSGDGGSVHSASYTHPASGQIKKGLYFICRYLSSQRGPIICFRKNFSPRSKVTVGMYCILPIFAQNYSIGIFNNYLTTASTQVNGLTITPQGALVLNGVASNNGVITNNLHIYLTIECDTVNQEMRLYINDNELPLITAPTTLSEITSFSFGQSRPNVDTWYPGVYIDDVYILDDTGDSFNQRLGVVEVYPLTLEAVSTESIINNNNVSHTVKINDPLFDKSTVFFNSSFEDVYKVVGVNTSFLNFLGIVASYDSIQYPYTNTWNVAFSFKNLVNDEEVEVLSTILESSPITTWKNKAIGFEFKEETLAYTSLTSLDDFRLKVSV